MPVFGALSCTNRCQIMSFHLLFLEKQPHIGIDEVLLHIHTAVTCNKAMIIETAPLCKTRNQTSGWSRAENQTNGGPFNTL